MSKKSKIEEIFSDYKTNSNIKYATVTALNVVKKTNTLEVVLYFDEYIEIKEIWYFEKFLQERFKFEHIDIKINYHEQVDRRNIKDEWRNIIAYMAHKYPLAKPMLLLNADIEIEQKNITVKMHIRGCEFLKAKKTDKELEKVLKNLFGIDYKIEIIEEISKEELRAIKENMQKEEARIIAHIEEENRKNRVEKEPEDMSYAPVPEYNDVDYMPPTDLEGYIPEESANQTRNRWQDLPTKPGTDGRWQLYYGKTFKSQRKVS